MDLRNASMSKTINSEKLSDKLSGLKENDRIVKEGLSRLNDGMTIRPIKN